MKKHLYERVTYLPTVEYEKFQWKEVLQHTD